MKNTFHAHFRPTNEEFKELWNNSIIAVDTNILLNLYRYSPKTQTVLFQVLESFKDRLWLPYRAGNEYFKNRISTMSDQIKSYKEISDSIKKNLKSIKDNQRHPFANEATLTDFEQVFAKIESEFLIETELLNKKIVNDDILIRISEIFDKKVGIEFSDEDLKTILTEGETRYSSKIPPGFKDDKKNDPDLTSRFGDLIIWKELIAKAKQDNKSLIFITDDKKEDWWLVGDGKTIGPLPQLLGEFKRESQQQFYMYTADQFITLATDQKEVDQDVIQELKDIREEQAQISEIVQFSTSTSISQGANNNLIFTINKNDSNSFSMPSLFVDGRLIFSGPGFDNLNSAIDWINSVVSNSKDLSNFTRHQTSMTWTFLLRNSSQEFIASSGKFLSNIDMENIITSIHRNADKAEITIR